MGKELNTHNLLIVDKVNKEWMTIKMDNLPVIEPLKEQLKDDE